MTTTMTVNNRATIESAEALTYDDLCGDEQHIFYQRPLYDRVPVFHPNDPIEKKTWVTDGVIIKKNFIPTELIDRYRAVRDHVPTEIYLSGWSHPTPYMECEELKDICLFPELMNLIKDIFCVDFGLHLNLTGYVSTERDWHPDDYLNPEFVNAWYCAVWMALDDIHRDSGPFEYIPGSHRWPSITRKKVFEMMPTQLLDNHNWPGLTQGIIGKLCQQEIDSRGAKSLEFVPDKGDLLIWHSRLLHRGSKPRNPNLQRKALIAHYSAIDRRNDMPPPIKHSGGYYFPIKTKQDYNKYIPNPMK